MKSAPFMSLSESLMNSVQNLHQQVSRQTHQTVLEQWGLPAQYQ
jgi:hypothetical protein